MPKINLCEEDREAIRSLYTHNTELRWVWTTAVKDALIRMHDAAALEDKDVEAAYQSCATQDWAVEYVAGKQVRYHDPEEGVVTRDATVEDALEAALVAKTFHAFNQSKGVHARLKTAFGDRYSESEDGAPIGFDLRNGVPVPNDLMINTLAGMLEGNGGTDFSDGAKSMGYCVADVADLYIDEEASLARDARAYSVNNYLVPESGAERAA